jgi:hypothetical protein
MPSLLLVFTSAESTAMQQYNRNGGSSITLRNSRTGDLYTSDGEAQLGEFSNYYLNRALLAFPPSAIVTAEATLTTAQAAVNTAQAALNALTAPTLTGGFNFALSATNPTIAHGSSGTTTLTLALVDPSYTGTITFALLNPPAGIAATFSPSSLSAGGTSTGTITVGSGVTPGTYPLEIVGTDGGNLTNSCIFSLIVT